MKPFHFRLQPLLRIRRQEEDARKRDVAVLQNRINEQQQQALDLNRALQQEGQILRQRHESGSVNLEWVGHYHRYVTSAHQAIHQRIARVGEIQKDLHHARTRLIAAARETKKLEMLKQKRKEQYDIQLRRREQIIQDEIATQAWQRNAAQRSIAGLEGGVS